MNNLVYAVLSKVAKFLVFLPKKLLTLLAKVAKMLLKDPRKLFSFITLIAIIAFSRWLVLRAE